jgi:hypothetical protein
VRFELLFELKIEQKSVLYTIPRVKGCVKPQNSLCADSTVCPSELSRWISPHGSGGNLPQTGIENNTHAKNVYIVTLQKTNTEETKVLQLEILEKKQFNRLLQME